MQQYRLTRARRLLCQFSSRALLAAPGEIVDLSGPVHVLITFTINGNNVTGRVPFQPQGISATGETTGISYQATGLTAENFTTSLENGQATLTFINRFDIIGQGTNNNLLVQETA